MNNFTETSAVIFKNLSVTLGGVPILANVSAHVPLHGSTAIVGPNGAGKTTLLMALLGQVPFDGTIDYNPKDPRVGYVPQRVAPDRGLPLTVLEFMVLGPQLTPLWFGVGNRHRDQAMECLQDVKAETLAKRRVGTLSGGELQRVLLALALQRSPDLLVLDEPAASVDFQGELLFCELLERVRSKKKFTQLMVSHDLESVAQHATHVICLNRRVTAEGPPREVLTPDILTTLYGMHMGLLRSPATVS